jgi:hypothetical protein
MWSSSEEGSYSRLMDLCITPTLCWRLIKKKRRRNERRSIYIKLNDFTSNLNKSNRYMAEGKIIPVEVTARLLKEAIEKVLPTSWNKTEPVETLIDKVLPGILFWV